MIDGRLIICGWIILLAACPRVAAPFDSGDLMNQFAHPSHTENRGISLDEAVSRVRRQSDGRILSAETVRRDGRRVYRIKVLSQDGRVSRVDIDADTGRAAPRGR
jgi:uncharacterized membrane protein YkoI